MQLLFKTTPAVFLTAALSLTTAGYAQESIKSQINLSQSAPLFLAPEEISLENLQNTEDLLAQTKEPLKITTLPSLSPKQKQSYEDFKQYENTEQIVESQGNAASFQYNPDFTPLCPTLDIDTTYTLSGTFTGDSYCYHFTIPTRSKTTTYITDQNIETDFSLSLLYDDGENNLYVLGTSNSPSNNDEIVQAITEPGHYYWFLEANNSTGDPISFGAMTSTTFDQYEINDTRNQATIVPDGMHTYIANSDNSIDYDYYSFTAIRGQNIGVYFKGTANNSNRWILGSSHLRV